MRTNGSYVQRKGSSVVWRFEDADLEFGAQQAKEMREHLDNLLQGYPVDVQVGKGYVEIKPAGVDKGVIVSLMLSHLAASSGGVDFVLCVGDDSSDEKMFEALHSRLGGGHSTPLPTSPRGLSAGQPSAHVFCATVGRKPSAAPYYVNDHEEVLELLQSLRLHSTRSNRNRSLTDLNRLGHHPHRAVPGGGPGGGGERAAPHDRNAPARSSIGGIAHGALVGAAAAAAAGSEFGSEFGPRVGGAVPSGAARTAEQLPMHGGGGGGGLYGQRAAWAATRSSDVLPGSSATPIPARYAQVRARHARRARGAAPTTARCAACEPVSPRLAHAPRWRRWCAERARPGC